MTLPSDKRNSDRPRRPVITSSPGNTGRLIRTSRSRLSSAWRRIVPPSSYVKYDWPRSARSGTATAIVRRVSSASLRIESLLKPMRSRAPEMPSRESAFLLYFQQLSTTETHLAALFSPRVRTLRHRYRAKGSGQRAVQVRIDVARSRGAANATRRPRNLATQHLRSVSHRSSSRNSGPIRQTIGENPRQPGFEDRGLRLGNVVRNPEELRGHPLRVEDGERGGWIAVPRLADRTGVDQITELRRETDRGVPSNGSSADVVVFVDGEDHRKMGMAVQNHGSVVQSENLCGMGLVEHVLV